MDSKTSDESQVTSRENAAGTAAATPMSIKPNVYSREWFQFFHVGLDEARTNREAKFVSSCAPLPDFRKVLDVCCGMGRHARALASLGYSVVGIDRDADIISKARGLGGGPGYVVADIREYAAEASAFDVAIVMSQSFGYFDAATNRDMLRRLTNSLRHSGRIILDLWNPEFFNAHQGERELRTARGSVRESKKIKGHRLFVDLEYPDGQREQFEWQLFTQATMTDLARSLGLAVVVACTDFDANVPSASSNPRLQFVLERWK